MAIVLRTRGNGTIEYDRVSLLYDAGIIKKSEVIAWDPALRLTNQETSNNLTAFPKAPQQILEELHFQFPNDQNRSHISQS